MLINFSLKKSSIYLALTVSFYIAYNLFYSFRILPNSYFAGSDISGKRFSEAERQISERLNSFERAPLDLVIEGQTIQADLTSLGISFNKEQLQSKIKEENRNNLWQLRSFKTKRITPEYSVDFEKFSAQLDFLLKNYETPATDATITHQGGKFVIKDEKTGNVVDRTKLVLDLRNLLENFSSKTIEVNKITTNPRVKREGAQKALDKINLLSGQKIILTFGQDNWEISGKRLLDLLRLSPTDYEEGYLAKLNFGGQLTILTQLELADSEDLAIKVTVNRRGLDNFIGEIAKSIDKQTVDATIKFDGERVVEFTPAIDGQKLDLEQTKNLILETIAVENPLAKKSITIKLPVTVTPAKIASQEINSLGIKELIGRGVSYFVGSIPNRVHNIKLAALRASGTIVKPGEIFSFNKTVGEVSSATGYKQAYVISSGRTVLDDGGGICQVSTTLFRAVLNAGLPIAARTAHAYRVGYYEQRGFKPGLDATVWAPSVDFQFRNETDNHVLVQAIVDTANAKLEIDIYGTKDGRRIEITESVVSNRKPALADKYQEDPSLPRGVVKQVDFSAEGALVTFSRKVFRGGTIIIDETFKSNYRPWQAVYLVGTGG